MERQQLWQRAESPQCVFVLDETLYAARSAGLRYWTLSSVG